jgi:hypothetical protein
MSLFGFNDFSFPFENLLETTELNYSGVRRNYKISFPRAATISSRRIVYRGTVAGEFVFSINTLPIGADDIVIIGEID